MSTDKSGQKQNPSWKKLILPCVPKTLLDISALLVNSTWLVCEQPAVEIVNLLLIEPKTESGRKHKATVTTHFPKDPVGKVKSTKGDYLKFSE